MNRFSSCWFELCPFGLKALRGMLFFFGILFLGLNSIATAEGPANQNEIPTRPHSFQVAIPGLGQNPWVLESFFKQNGVNGSEGRDAAIQEQLKTLKKLLEGQNIPLNTQQKSLLESMIQSPGSSGPGVDNLKDLAKSLISKADPSQQDFLREKLTGMGKSGGVEDLLKSLGKLTPQGQPSFQGFPKIPSFSKMIAPPIPEPDSPNAKQSNQAISQPPLSPNTPPMAIPQTPPRAGDLSRMFSRVLPFGLDKALAPLGKEMLGNAKGLLGNIKIPESWKPGLRNAFKDFKLPTNLGGMTPSLPRAPIGDSISGSKMVFGFVGSFALLIFLIWFLPKVVKVGNSPDKSLTRFPSSRSGEGLIARLELAVLKIGGEPLAFGNHKVWKEQCGPRLVALGMAEEFVDHVFSVYEREKYGKSAITPEAEERLLETLKRHV